MAVLLAPLEADPSVMCGLGGLDAEGNVGPDVVKPRHHVLGPPGRDRVEYPSAADGNEEEDAPEDSPEVLDQLGDSRQVVDGPRTDGRVGLQREPGLCRRPGRP